MVPDPDISHARPIFRKGVICQGRKLIFDYPGRIGLVTGEPLVMQAIWYSEIIQSAWQAQVFNI